MVEQRAEGRTEGRTEGRADGTAMAMGLPDPELPNVPLVGGMPNPGVAAGGGGGSLTRGGRCWCTKR